MSDGFVYDNTMKNGFVYDNTMKNDDCNSKATVLTKKLDGNGGNQSKAILSYSQYNRRSASSSSTSEPNVIVRKFLLPNIAGSVSNFQNGGSPQGTIQILPPAKSNGLIPKSNAVGPGKNGSAKSIEGSPVSVIYKPVGQSNNGYIPIKSDILTTPGPQIDTSDVAHKKLKTVVLQREVLDKSSSPNPTYVINGKSIIDGKTVVLQTSQNKSPKTVFLRRPSPDSKTVVLTGSPLSNAKKIVLDNKQISDYRSVLFKANSMPVASNIIVQNTDKKSGSLIDNKMPTALGKAVILQGVSPNSASQGVLVPNNTNTLHLEIVNKTPGQKQRETAAMQARQALKFEEIGKLRCVRVEPRTLEVRNSYSQTELFSLLEPGRLVEVTDEDTPESDGTAGTPSIMVAAGDINNCATSSFAGDTAPEPKRIKLDNGNIDLNAEENGSCLGNHNLNEKINVSDKVCRTAYIDWVFSVIADTQGNIPLHNAVMDADLNQVKRQCFVLSARKHSIDTMNFEGETPLHIALTSESCMIEIIETLLNFGANPSVADSHGNNAYHLAVLRSKDGLACVKLLMKHTALQQSINIKNDDGFTPLHLCAIKGKVKEAEIFINKGANLNVKDSKSGKTPLFHAVERANVAIIRLLMASGADSLEPNYAGHTPVYAASDFKVTNGTDGNLLLNSVIS